MGDTRISRKLRQGNGNVLSSCVTPQHLNALETMSLTGEVQVCEKQPDDNKRGI